MLRIGVMISGGGTNLQAILDALDSGAVTNTELTAVISSSGKAGGLERARKKNIPALIVSPKDYDSRDAFGEALLKAIDGCRADLIVLAGYLVQIPEAVVKRYRNRMINIHPSLIPSFCGAGYYGLRVHEAALARGVKVTGATVHFVDEGTDTGPILLQKAVKVRCDDTPESLQRRVMEEAEWILLPEAINRIANGRIMIG